MKRALVVVGMLGCTTVPPPVMPPAPIANRAPPAQRPQVTLQEEWPTQAGDRIVAHTPAGPFSDLDAVCAALDRKKSESNFEGCQTSEQDALGGAIIRIGQVQTWEPMERDEGMPVRIEYLAIETRGGWYVLPRLGDTGNRYSSLFFEAKRVTGGVVIEYAYDESTAGRFASDTEKGLIVCKAVDGVAACTPKIVTRKYSQRLETSQPDWPTTMNVELACRSSFESGALTVAAIPTPDPVDSDFEWTADAASACTGLAYAGTHPIAF